MTWLTPISTGFLAWAALWAAVLTVVAYILKMRRRRFEVPFSSLWKRVLEQRDASALWQQLRRWLSLALLLAILGLVFVAIMAPTLGVTDRRARNVVILLDTSASMRATDGDRERPKLTRFERARERTAALIDSMGGGDQAMIMRVDSQATPLSRFASDKPMLRRILEQVQPADTAADLPRALSAAADALRGRPNPMIVIVSDGAYSELQLAQATFGPGTGTGAGTGTGTGSGTGTGAGTGTDSGTGTGTGAGVAPADEDPDAAASRERFASQDLAAVDLSGIDVHYLGVGSRAENVGIVAFNVRRYIANKAAYEVFIEVQNFGTEPAKRQLALYNGETAIEVKPIELAPGERKREIYRQLPGGESQLRASLRPVDGPGGSDPFALDDEAWALLPARKLQHVLVVTKDNLYLEGALLVYDNIAYEKRTPEEYDAAPATIVVNPATKRPYDVVVFDDHTPAVLPPAPVNVLMFNPSGPASPFTVRAELPRPRITETNEAHPVMKWVTLSDVNIDRSNVFAVDRGKGEVALALSVRDPIAVARRDEGRKLLAFGWSLGGTDLMLRVAFPLLLVNALDWFAGDDADLVTTYATGTRLRIPLDGLVALREVTIVDPAGRRAQAPLVDGVATFVSTRVGVHQILAYPPTPPPAPGEPPPQPVTTGEPLARMEVATNLGSPTESRVAPTADLVLGGQTLGAPPAFAVSARRDLWIYVILLVVALLCVEWITYHRRITV